jgi:hypothetical protein
MKTTIQLSILSLLLFCTTTGLKAQDKYDYAIVKYINPNLTFAEGGIFVSISGKEFEKVNVKGIKNGQDDTPLVNYVQEMTNNGWRVINTFAAAQNGLGTAFILERKRTEMKEPAAPVSR